MRAIEQENFNDMSLGTSYSGKVIGEKPMYKLMTAEFETYESPYISAIYNATIKHFGEDLLWTLLYAAGIRGNENPCKDWGVEPINGLFLLDANSVHNFDRDADTELHEAKFVASFEIIDLPFTAWDKKPFYDKAVFSMRIVERELFQIYSIDEIIFEEIKKLGSVSSFKYFCSEDAVNWTQTS